MKKTILQFSYLSFSLFFFGTSFCSATTVEKDKDDCVWVSSYFEDGFDLTYNKELELNYLSKNEMVVALYHTFDSCCKLGSYEDDDRCNSLDKTLNLPLSPYFLDHLVDVGFRKVDGSVPKGYEYGEFKVVEEPQSLEWKKIVKDFSTNVDGTKGSDLYSKFNDFWYGSNGLMSKYYTICSDLVGINNEYNGNSNQLSSLNLNKREIRITCAKLVSSKIEQELDYLSYLASKNINRAINSNIEEFFGDYFDSFDELVMSFNQMYGWFRQINAKYVATKDCN